MHKAEIAERFLSLMVDPEKAASVVGDLVETSSLSIGTVLRIAGAETREQALARPGRIAALALAGFLGQFAFALAFGLLAFLSWALRVHVPFLLDQVLYFLAQIVVGVYLARRAKDNAIAVCIALGAINFATGSMGLHNASIDMAFWQIPVVIGTVWQGQRRLRHA